MIKGTVCVISSDPTYKEGTAWFTTVAFKHLYSTAEYKRVLISLNTHISVLNEHTTDLREPM